MGVNKLSASRRDTERLKGLRTEREMLEIRLQRYFGAEPAPEEAASRPQSPWGGAESARSLPSAFSGSAGSAGGQQSPRGGAGGMLSLPQSPRSGASSPRVHGRQTPRGSVARTPLGSLGLGRLHCPRPSGAVERP